jgi:hypothetical protein
LKSFEVNVNLALIVGGTTGVDVAVANGGLEGGSGPKMKRLGRLNIVMPIKKNGGLARSVERFRVDERMQSGRYDFNRFKSGRTEIVGDPASGALDVGFVFRFGTDAGNTQKFVQFGEILVTA